MYSNGQWLSVAVNWVLEYKWIFKGIHEIHLLRTAMRPFCSDLYHPDYFPLQIDVAYPCHPLAVGNENGITVSVYSTVLEIHHNLRCLKRLRFLGV